MSGSVISLSVKCHEVRPVEVSSPIDGRTRSHFRCPKFRLRSVNFSRGPTTCARTPIRAARFLTRRAVAAGALAALLANAKATRGAAEVEVDLQVVLAVEIRIVAPASRPHVLGFGFRQSALRAALKIGAAASVKPPPVALPMW
jgi:hypothetical protein